jgi:hypothetical protein
MGNPVRSIHAGAMMPWLQNSTLLELADEWPSTGEILKFSTTWLGVDRASCGSLHPAYDDFRKGLPEGLKHCP